MKKHLNTLYVTSASSWLGLEGETVYIKQDDQVKMRVPLHRLEGIIVFGNVSVSPFLLGACAEKGIGVTFLSEYGRFLARVQGPVSGNVLLRKTQYRWADDPVQQLEVARFFVLAKVANIRSTLQRFIRDYPNDEGVGQIKATCQWLQENLWETQKVESIDALRGVEGTASRRYFAVFNHLIRTDDPAFTFHGRSRRPPMDPVNGLLSFLYTLLLHDCRSALESIGLDPQVGYLHADRPGRPSLALDLMEEFRAFLADRLALTLINRRQLSGKDFIIRETGGVTMEKDALKKVITAYQTRKAEELTHPFLNEKVTIGRLMYIQALLLARYIRGDLESYPAFIWK